MRERNEQMKHIFIVNTTAGKESCLDMVKEGIAQCAEVIDFEIYTPDSPNDSINFIKTYLENHPELQIN